MNYKEKKAKAASLSSPKGMCSYDSNPMKEASKVPFGVGPGPNRDQKKVNMLLMKQHNKMESLRGKGVM